jgi:uncharacterized protein
MSQLSRRAAITGLAFAVAGCQHKQAIMPNPLQAKLVAAGREQTRRWVTYDSGYSRIAYPNGDVPVTKGVCADVIIRAYRALGIDLQMLVHEDMQAYFSLYPTRWGLTAPDANIDHRRVPNLEVFFGRFAKSLIISRRADDYQPGDLLTTRPFGRPHIAIVSERRSLFKDEPLVIQNAGFGVQENADLFSFPIVGHYRYGFSL